MQFEVNMIGLAVPELFLLVMGCSLLLVIAFSCDKAALRAYWVTQAALLTTALLLVQDYGISGQTFSGSYVKDALSDVLKIAITVFNMAVLYYGKAYLEQRDLFKGEFFVLALFATLGMLIMVSANQLIILYLGLELLSLCLYAMVALQRDSKLATEAAMKYFVLGALASGMLLYGMSMIYGATGSLALNDIAFSVEQGTIDTTVISFALVFLVIGLGFKFGAVPFHMWLPDVYHGAPTAVTLFIATAPKLAALAMAIRLLVTALGDAAPYWQGMLILLAVASIVLGNITAIAQTNLKRMLAYSTISHVGFIFLGLLAGNAEGYSAALFYALSYALMTLGGFGMILLFAKRGFEAEYIHDFTGLGRSHPWYALLVSIVMLSMAGIPPLLGFYAKLAVIKAVVDIDLLAVAIIAVLMSVIGAFYYLRLIKVMFFDECEKEQFHLEPNSIGTVFGINTLAVLALGIFPGTLLTLCEQVFM